MNEAFSLLIERDRVRRLIRRGRHGQSREVIEPVWTVEEVCRRLRKSRRQVYRYLHTGRLQPCARALGQWLFASEAVQRFPQTVVPRALRPFFWDVSLPELVPARHRDFILARLLEFGDRSAMRWVFRTYSRETLASFLKSRAAGRLSRRARHFWTVQVGLPAPRRATPRRRDWWGSRP